MNKQQIAILLGTLLCVTDGRGVEAATLVYEISGEVAGTFPDFAGDAAADLLGVPRNAQNTLPFSLKLTVDPDVAPASSGGGGYFGYGGYTATYRDAILAAKLNLNGVIFETQRKPVVFSSSDSEASINLTDVLNVSQDVLTLKLVDENPAGQVELFSSKTVPVNQSYEGVTYTSASISVGNFGLNLTGGNILDGTKLPKAAGTLDADYRNFGFLLTTDFSSANQSKTDQSVVALGASTPAGGILKFTVSTVSDPQPGTQEQPLSPPPNPTPHTGGKDDTTYPVSGQVYVTHDQRDTEVEVGETNTYTVGYTNTSSYTATRVRMTNRLPREAKAVSASSSDGKCTVQRRRVQCVFGSVAPGETVSAEVEAEAEHAGRWESRAVFRYRMQRGNGVARKGNYSVVSRVWTDVTDASGIR